MYGRTYTRYPAWTFRAYTSTLKSRARWGRLRRSNHNNTQSTSTNEYWSNIGGSGKQIYHR